MSCLIKLLKRLKEKLAMLYSYYLRYPVLSKKFKFEVLSPEKTTEVILEKKVSVSRFGDGELLLLMQRGNPGFQAQDERLAKRLREILATQEPGIMICLTDIMLTTAGLVRHSAEYCRCYVCREFENLKRFIPEARIYGNTNFTRFYADHAKKEPEVMQHKLEKIREIWGGVFAIYY